MLPRSFAVEAVDASGTWQRLRLVENNCQRVVRLPLEIGTRVVRLVLLEAWGGEQSHGLAFDVSK